MRKITVGTLNISDKSKILLMKIINSNRLAGSRAFRQKIYARLRGWTGRKFVQSGLEGHSRVGRSKTAYQRERDEACALDERLLYLRF